MEIDRSSSRAALARARARKNTARPRAAVKGPSSGLKLTRRFYGVVAVILALALLIIIVVSASSGGNEGSFAALPGTTGLGEADLNNMKINEMGAMMVLEYHRIGEEGRWSRTPENFRSDLDLLYKEGYRAIRLCDLAENNINVAPGCTPAAFTFDDADPSQFRYVEQDGQLAIDPRCGVGVMEDFKKAHPDFNMTATFYVLPTLFGQDEYTEKKLRFLVDNGYDIGNHTLNHPSLSDLSDNKVMEELTGNISMVQKYLPNYQELSIALPNGAEPKNQSLLNEGSLNGVKYSLVASLLVGANPSPAPCDASFDPMRMPRIQALDPSLDKGNSGIYAWLNYFMENPERRYISDGEPNTVTVPKHMAGRVDMAKLGDRRLKTY